MVLKKIPPRWWPLAPRPQVKRLDRLRNVLVQLAKHDPSCRGRGLRWDANDPDIQELVARNLVELRREPRGFWRGTTKSTVAHLTGSGWDVIWHEKPLTDPPTPKSERPEKRSRHV